MRLSRLGTKSKLSWHFFICKMGCVLARPMDFAYIYRIRRLFGDKFSVSSRVKQEVEMKLFQDRPRSIESLVQYIDLQHPWKPKQARTKEYTWKELEGCDAIDHPYYNYLTQDFTQFFYDCNWYEYYLRVLK